MTTFETRARPETQTCEHVSATTFETQGRLLYRTYKDEEIASKKFPVFSDMTPCRLESRYRRFGEAHFVRL